MRRPCFLLAALTVAWLSGCSSHSVNVVDLHADFREIWTGVEHLETGKETNSDAKVTLEFNVPLKPGTTVGTFVPVDVDPHCGDAVPAARDASAVTASSALALVASRPLARGCTYQFWIPDTAPLGANGARLSKPFSVTFRVTEHGDSPAREFVKWERDSRIHTQSFTIRPGINTPVDEALLRYQRELGISVSELVPIDPPEAGTGVTFYEQYASGYRVAGYGYELMTENGLLRMVRGRAFPGLPRFSPPQLTEAAALDRVLVHFHLAQAPWVAEPAKYQPPVGSPSPDPLGAT